MPSTSWTAGKASAVTAFRAACSSACIAVSWASAAAACAATLTGGFISAARERCARCALGILRLTESFLVGSFVGGITALGLLGERDDHGAVRRRLHRELERLLGGRLPQRLVDLRIEHLAAAVLTGVADVRLDGAHFALPLLSFSAALAAPSSSACGSRSSGLASLFNTPATALTAV